MFICCIWTPWHLAATMALCCVKIQQPSKPWLNISDLHKFKLCLTKLTRQTHSTAYRDQSPGIWPPTAAARHHAWTTALGTITRGVVDSRLPARISTTRTAKTALSSPDLLGLRIWWSYKLTRAHMRRRGVCLVTTCRFMPSTRWKTLADVIWRHQVMSSLHVSSHASTSTLALVHVSDTS